MQATLKRLVILLGHESATNIFWQFFEKFITLGLTFIVSIYLIRYLGPVQYGMISYSASYVLLFSALTTVGLQTIVIREISKGKIKPEQVMGSAFIIMLSGSVLAAILALSGAFIGKDQITLIIIISFGCLTNVVASLSVINYYLMADLKSRYTSYIVIGQKIVDSMLTFVLIHYKSSIIAIASLLLIESVIVYLILYLLYNKISLLSKWRFTFATAKYLLKESVPLAISGAVVNLYTRLDQVMIEHFKGLSAVGMYSVGIKLSELLYILPGILSVNIFPLMVKKYSNSIDEFNALMVKIYRIFFYVSLILAFSFFIMAKPLVNLLYGNQYVLSGLVFKYGVLSVIAAFIGIINHLWLQIKGLQRYAVYTTLCGLVCCFVLNLILIPIYGVIGAVFVMLFTQITASIFAFMLFDNTRECFKLFMYGVLFRRSVHHV